MIGEVIETSESSDTSLLLHLDELPELLEKTVKYSGRCEVVRQLGGLTFLRVASQYFSLQVVVLDSTLRNATSEIRQGDIISVRGLLRSRPDAHEHPVSPRIDPNKYEVVLQQFTIILRSQKIDLLTEKDAKSRQSLRHRQHQASQLISLVRLHLKQKGFVQLQAPSSTDFHEQQRVREFTALSDNSSFSSPLFRAYTIEQLMHGSQRFYFFVEGTGALPDLIHIVIAHHEPDLHAHEDLLTSITGHVIELLAPDIQRELAEAATGWQDLTLHTFPSLRIASSYTESTAARPLTGANNGKRIAILRCLRGTQEASSSIATAMSLVLGPFKAAMEGINPAKQLKPPAQHVLADTDTENGAAYEAYSKLDSEHQMLLVERSLWAFNPSQDLDAARFSSQAALRYMEPALHHYGIDSAMAQRFLSLQARLHGDDSTAVCPIALFQLLWTVLGNPSAKLLLQSNTSRDRLLFTFVNQRILTDIRQLVFIHPSAVDALELLLERIRDKDTLGRLRTLLRNVIARTPTELATLLTTLAAMEPASTNAAIAETKQLENAVKHGLTTPYWLPLSLGREDLTPLINSLRLSNIQSSQRLLGNSPVFTTMSENSVNMDDAEVPGNHDNIPLAEIIYTLFRPVTAGISELKNALPELQDHCAHVERAGLRRFNLAFIQHLHCYRYIIHQQQQFHDHIRIYLSKNAASFFAKSTTGICTDSNRELFKRADHFHLNIFSENLGRVIGNVQLYTLSIHNEKALLIRGINPIKNYATPCLVDELLNCVIACAKDLATENDFSLICVAEQNGLWNSNSNRPEMRAALAQRAVYQDSIVLERPFHLYNYFTTEIYLSSVYPLWRNPR